MGHLVPLHDTDQVPGLHRDVAGGQVGAEHAALQRPAHYEGRDRLYHLEE